MKIVFLARYLPDAGSTIHIYTLAEELINRGNKVYLISSGPNKNEGAIKIFKDIENHGLKHYKVSFPNKKGMSRFEQALSIFNYIISTPKALYLLFKIKPDVIHVHYPVTSFIAKLYKFLTKKKFVATYHTIGIPKHLLHQRADVVIAISQDLKSELIDRFNYKNSQIRLIFNGISQTRFDVEIDRTQKLIIKKELELPVEKPLIGFVGSLDYNKGIDILLKACSTIEFDFHIVLLGDGDRNWVKELIKKYQLDGKISLYSFQDPVKFYSVFDVLVLPSRKEGFPLVPIEAMMMGVPVIRSNVGGAFDQIKNGYNGFIFEKENYKSLANYIDILLKDNNLRATLGNNAKDYSIKNFNQKNMVDKIIEVYKELLN